VDYRYDFFVSFTEADAAWAEWIAEQAERVRGVDDSPSTVLFQKWDFVPGTNWVTMIDNGVQQAARIIPVLTERYLRHCPYGTAEWQAVWQNDPNGVDRRVLPVRVSKCDPTGLLGAIVYIDLADLSAAEATTTLADGLHAAVHGRRSRRGVPFPGPDHPLA